MSNPPSATPARNGLSLYANLLDPSSSDTPGSITKGPIVFKTGTASVEDEAPKKPQIDAGMLQTICKIDSKFVRSSHEFLNSRPKISTYKKTTTSFSKTKNQISIPKSFLNQPNYQRAQWRTGGESASVQCCQTSF